MKQLSYREGNTKKKRKKKWNDHKKAESTFLLDERKKVNKL